MAPTQPHLQSCGHSGMSGEPDLLTQRLPLDKEDDKEQIKSLQPAPPKEVFQQLAEQDHAPRKLLIFAAEGALYDEFLRRLGVEFSNDMPTLETAWINIHMFHQPSRLPLRSLLNDSELDAVDAFIFIVDNFYSHFAEREIKSVLSMDDSQSKPVLILVDESVDATTFLSDKCLEKLSNIGPKHSVRMFAAGQKNGSGMNDALEWFMNQMSAAPKSQETEYPPQSTMKRRWTKRIFPVTLLSNSINFFKKSLTFGAK